MSLGKAKKSLSEYSTGELVMFRFRKNKLAMFGVVLLAVIVVTILIAPLISSYDAVVQMNMADRFQSPNAKYLFGTDEFGRDLFARILYGGRISMFASLAVIGIAFVIGAIMGGAAGYLGGKVDSVLMRAVDVLMAVPVWDNVHPLLKVIPVDWSYSIPYGLLHSPEPSVTVKKFLSALQKVL